MNLSGRLGSERIPINMYNEEKWREPPKASFAFDSLEDWEGGMEILKRWTKLLQWSQSSSANSVCVSSDGTIYIAGNSSGTDFESNTGFGNSDAFLTKYNNDGTKAWTRVLGTWWYDGASAVSSSSDGSIYITGSTNGDLDGHSNPGKGSDAFVAKYNSSGSKEWTRVLPTSTQSYGKSITTGSDGSVYITGESQTYFENFGRGGAFLIKYNSDGTKAWSQLVGPPEWKWGDSITTSHDGSLYVIGYSFDGLQSNPAGTNGDVFLAKYDTSGASIWTRLIGSTKWDNGYSVATAYDGSIYIAGATEGDIDGNINSGSRDAFIAKYNSEGDRVWSRTLGSSDIDQANSISIGENNSIYVTGYTNSGIDGYTSLGESDIFFSKFNSDGTKAWTQLIGSTRSDSGTSISTSRDGEIYIVGNTLGALDGSTPPNHDSSGFIIKYSSTDYPGQDNPGVTVNGTDRITTENGDSAVISFALNSRPTDLVTLTFTVSDSTEAKLSVSSFTFTASNWNIPQSLIITGIDDLEDDGDISYTLSTIISSKDSDYGPGQNGMGGIQVTGLSLINSDDGLDKDLTIYGDNGGTGVVNDQLKGFNGRDRLYGILGRDVLKGGPNDDRLYGGLDDDILYGEDGSDQLFGDEDDDRLFGGKGNDRLNGGEGVDLLVGGEGNDIYIIDDELDIIDDRGPETDIDTIVIRGSLNSFSLGRGIENGTLEGSTATLLTGNSLVNSLTGNSVGNTLDGKSGADAMAGRGGNDTYIVDNVGDKISEYASQGSDIVNSSVSYTLGAHLEVLILRGTNSIYGTGNILDNTLTGNSANNHLNGGAGLDSLFGGGGDDLLIGGTSKDILAGSTGIDSFIYKSVIDSGVGNEFRDIIIDFNKGTTGELIDLSGIDANPFERGNQAFTYIGMRGFTGTQGEVRFSDGVLQINTSMDTNADMEIALSGIRSFGAQHIVL